MTVNGEEKIIIPTKIGYTFGGYYKKPNGEGNQMITKDGVITENFTNTSFSSNEILYASWIKNKVTIKYNVNGGIIKQETQDNDVVYKWKTDNSGLIYKDNNILETKINYGETLDKNGLKNYNNEKYLFITKKNNIGVKNAEWKCISGCSQIGKTFDQSITVLCQIVGVIPNNDKEI